MAPTGIKSQATDLKANPTPSLPPVKHLVWSGSSLTLRLLTSYYCLCLPPSAIRPKASVGIGAIYFISKLSVSPFSLISVLFAPEIIVCYFVLETKADKPEYMPLCLALEKIP